MGRQNNLCSPHAPARLIANSFSQFLQLLFQRIQSFFHFLDSLKGMLLFGILEAFADVFQKRFKRKKLT